VQRRRLERCYFHGVRFYFAVLATLLFAATASAQFSETLEVRVLEIEATVVDRQQRPVEGLTRDDFLVTIDGKPAEITNFSYVSRGATRDADAPAGQAAVEMPVPTRLIIVVDDLHLHPDSKRRALAALRKYVEETMDAATTATLITWNGALTTRTTPTSRRDILLSAIAASAKEIPRGMAIDAERSQLLAVRRQSGVSPTYLRMVENYAESRAEDVERTIGALEEIADHAATSVDGRKIILLISEGVPLHPAQEMFTTTVGTRQPPLQGARFNKGRRFEALARRAQEAGVVFSTIDPSDATSNDRITRDIAHEGVELLARETGGALIANQNDLDGALRTLDERVSTYYSLAVRAPAETGPQKIEVRVRNQPRLRVHYAMRRGMPSRDEAIATAIRTQLTRRSEDNPLDARFFVEVETKEKGCIAALQFLVPAEKLTLLPATEAVRGQLDVWFTVADNHGIEAPVRTRGIAVTPKHGKIIGHSQPIALVPGHYVVSTALVDRLSGATAYLQRDVECGG
jgi:VWFA-related protein